MISPKTKYLALDIGNVLCTVDIRPCLNTMSNLLNISVDEAEIFIKRFQKAHDLGYTSTTEEIISKFGPVSQNIIDQIIDVWNNSIIAHHEMLGMLNNIKDNYRVKIALLSNIGVEHAELIGKKLDYNGFLADVINHFSCEVGARKPSMLYYQSFLLQHPDAKGCLYVDDLPENIEMGHRMGFKPIQFDLTKPDADIAIMQLKSKIEFDCYGWHK